MPPHPTDSSGTGPRELDILLVEDNDGDIGLICEALEDISAELNLRIVKDGFKALEFIRTAAVKPRLIILDLNIPGKTGFDVLTELKDDPEWKEVPVIVFTSSSAYLDVRKAYRLHANSFVRKPTDVDEFFATVASIERFWARTAILPGFAG